eukprot:jgi/Botrbrau1/12583/Bobra.0169s0113.2
MAIEGEPEDCLGVPWIRKAPRSRYIWLEELGRGRFGTTYLVQHKETGEHFAVKQISKTQPSFKPGRILTEVKVHATLKDHPNVADLREVWEDSTHIYLIMEACLGGELFERVADGAYMSEAAAADVARVILQVLAYCHSQGIVHRDVKPENYLIQGRKQRPNRDTLRAVDFGSAAFIKPGEKVTGLVGSSYYMAPEVLAGKAYGMEVDVWSAGVILYVLLSGMPPFWGNTDQEIFASIRSTRLDLNTTPWPHISKAAKDLVSRMLARDPASRITTEEALRHPWLSDTSLAQCAPLHRSISMRLRSFTRLQRLKRLLLNIVAQRLSRQQIRDLHNLFVALDTDGNGHISMEELRRGLEAMGSHMDISTVQALMEVLDQSCDGQLGYVEFLAAALDRHKVLTRRTLSHIFHQLDHDGDGYITARDLKEALDGCDIHIDQSTMERLVEQQGYGGSKGLISAAAFQAMMMDRGQDMAPHRLDYYLAQARRHAASGHFRKVALLAMASCLGPGAVSGTRELFNRFDEDGLGIVCADDVRHALKASGDNLPEEELQGVFASLDTRGNGSITLDEFEAAALEAPHALNDARLKATFDFMDANGDGVVCLEDLKKTLCHLGLEADVLLPQMIPNILDCQSMEAGQHPTWMHHLHTLAGNLRDAISPRGRKPRSQKSSLKASSLSRSPGPRSLEASSSDEGSTHSLPRAPSGDFHPAQPAKGLPRGLSEGAEEGTAGSRSTLPTAGRQPGAALWRHTTTPSVRSDDNDVMQCRSQLGNTGPHVSVDSEAELGLGSCMCTRQTVSPPACQIDCSAPVQCRSSQCGASGALHACCIEAGPEKGGGEADLRSRSSGAVLCGGAKTSVRMTTVCEPANAPEPPSGVSSATPNGVSLVQSPKTWAGQGAGLSGLKAERTHVSSAGGSLLHPGSSSQCGGGSPQAHAKPLDMGMPGLWQPGEMDTGRPRRRSFEWPRRHPDLLLLRRRSSVPDAPAEPRDGDGQPSSPCGKEAGGLPATVALHSSEMDLPPTASGAPNGVVSGHQGEPPVFVPVKDANRGSSLEGGSSRDAGARMQVRRHAAGDAFRSVSEGSEEGRASEEVRDPGPIAVHLTFAVFKRLIQKESAEETGLHLSPRPSEAKPSAPQVRRGFFHHML